MSKRCGSGSSSSGKQPAKKVASPSSPSGPASERREEDDFEEQTLPRELDLKNESDVEAAPPAQASLEAQLEVIDEDDDDAPHVPSEAGIIHKIYCENFMNHKKLSIELCRNINFIHGQNGSGKSAILAALQICLGARASVTHRGDNLGGLVRRNSAGGHTANAKVRVTLLNGGIDAFRPAHYGSHITVERTFDAQGKSQYKLLDEQGKCVSTQKKDLEEMMDRLNVQVENPVCIMDQENSKEFIKGNEKDKYRFFKKATDLERTVSGIQETKTFVESMTAKREVAHESLRVVAKDAETAEKSLQDLQAVLKIHDFIKKAQCSLKWVEVEAKELEVRKLLDHQGNLVVKEAARAKTLEKATQLLANSKSPDEALAEINRLKSDSDAAQQNVDKLNREVAAAKKPVQAAERDIAIAKRRGQEQKSERKRLQKQIADACNDTKTSGGAEEQQKSAQLEAARLKHEAAEADMAAVKAELEALRPSLEAADRDWKDCTNKARDAEREVRELDKAVGELRNAQGAPATQFGNKVPAIAKLIAGDRSWDVLPVGPLGMHVKLRDGGAKKWAVAVGSHLGTMLRAYVVTSAKDKHTLEGIFKKCGAEFEHNIVTLRPCARYGSAGQKPLEAPQGLLTMEQVVHVEDDLAYNALIETCELEGQVLFDSHPEAEKTIFSGPKGSLRMAQFAKQSYNPTGSFTSVKNGNKFTVPAKKQRGVQFGVDSVERLQQAPRDLAEASKVMHSAKGAEREAKARVQDQDQANSNAERKLEQLEGGRQQRQATLTSLQRKLSDLQDADTVDTSGWEEQERAAAGKMEECAEEEEDARRAKALAENEVAQKVHARHAYEKTAHELGQQMQAAEDELTGVIRARAAGKASADKARRKVEEVAEATNQCQLQADEAHAALATATDSARTFTLQNLGADAKMPIKLGAGQGKDYLEAKIKALQQRKEEGLRFMPKGQRNLDEAMAKALTTRAVYNEKVAGVKKVEATIEHLQKDIRKRLKKWKRFRDTISRLTNKRFDNTLQRKGQSGEVTMDHQAETLSLTVQKDNRDSQSQIHNVKLLSGGERSTATLALLVALGVCLECPFRIMDEFDVFMDVVSRKIALELLVEEGLQNKHRQFVFITPQDLSSITPTPEVKIIKLQNPNRLVEGQATLG